MELIATAGSPTANSYVTLEDATTLLLAQRLHLEPWTAGADYLYHNQVALCWATRLLDEQVAWYGTPTTTTQALAWPMTGMVDPWGRPLDPLLIPQRLQLATALYALALRRDTSEQVGDAAVAGLASVRAGDTELVFRDEGSLPPPPARGIPAEVRSVLAPYGAMSGGINVDLVRV